MTNGRWQNVVTREAGAFRGGVMRTTGGSRVDVHKCRHLHATWTEARECAAQMEQERERQP